MAMSIRQLTGVGDVRCIYGADAAGNEYETNHDSDHDDGDGNGNAFALAMALAIEVELLRMGNTMAMPQAR